MEQLMQNLEQVFEDYPPMTLERCFVSHQLHMNAIIENRGDNNYKTPSINKSKIIRETGSLPKQIKVSDEAKEELRLLGISLL